MSLSSINPSLPSSDIQADQEHSLQQEDSRIRNIETQSLQGELTLRNARNHYKSFPNDFTLVQLIPEDSKESISIPQVILTASSQFFRALLSNRFRENNTSPILLAETKFSLEIFKRYLSEGQADDSVKRLTFSELEHLLSFADRRFAFSFLNYMRRTVVPNNYVSKNSSSPEEVNECWNVAKRFSIQSLLSACLDIRIPLRHPCNYLNYISTHATIALFLDNNDYISREELAQLHTVIIKDQLSLRIECGSMEIYTRDRSPTTTTVFNSFEKIPSSPSRMSNKRKLDYSMCLELFPEYLQPDPSDQQSIGAPEDAGEEKSSTLKMEYSSCLPFNREVMSFKGTFGHNTSLTTAFDILRTSVIPEYPNLKELEIVMRREFRTEDWKLESLLGKNQLERFSLFTFTRSEPIYTWKKVNE